MNDFPYKQGKATIALRIPGDYVWDTSVIKAEGKYWMFSSHWPYSKGFGWCWCFISRIFLSVSEKPEGPYHFVKDIFLPRGKEYFDGMNTHNTCIKYYNGKFYLYYMGATYDIPVPNHCDEIPLPVAFNTWNHKRIGLAVSDKIDGEYIRRDEPLFLPREYPHWDSTCTTNPNVIIKDNGETIMLYKSAIYQGEGKRDAPLKLGVAIANKPDGPFTRLYDKPILDFPNKEISLEDPFLWFDKKKNKYCVIMKDCIGNVANGWGNLIYAESDDCKTFNIEKDPTVITRNLIWEDGHKSLQCNLERPWLLFNEQGEPTHIFCATGEGKEPFMFESETYIVCIKLEKRNKT